jgi:hypothetical protein
MRVRPPCDIVMRASGAFQGCAVGVTVYLRREGSGPAGSLRARSAGQMGHN